MKIYLEICYINMFLVSSLMEDDIYLTSCYEIFRPYCIHWWPYTKLSPFLLNHVSMHYDIGQILEFLMQSQKPASSFSIVVKKTMHSKYRKSSHNARLFKVVKKNQCISRFLNLLLSLDKMIR